MEVTTTTLWQRGYSKQAAFPLPRSLSITTLIKQLYQLHERTTSAGMHNARIKVRYATITTAYYSRQTDMQAATATALIVNIAEVCK